MMESIFLRMRYLYFYELSIIIIIIIIINCKSVTNTLKDLITCFV